MPELEFSQVAQHWANVVLIWVGFGSLAGLLARISAAGPRTLQPSAHAWRWASPAVPWAWPSSPGPRDRPLNPSVPWAFWPLPAGAAVLLVLYQIIRAGRSKPGPTTPRGRSRVKAGETASVLRVKPAASIHGE